MTNPDERVFAVDTIPRLTKREYFAAMAMQALIERMPGRLEIGPVSTAALGFADGLIAELNKEPSK